MTTTHDSYLSQAVNNPAAVVSYVNQVKAIMNREWPEFGEIPGFGLFRCPVDFKVGLNWGDRHDCSELGKDGKVKCLQRDREHPEEFCEEHNLDGLEDFDKWLKKHPLLS